MVETFKISGLELERIKTSAGKSLAQLSDEKPVLLVFLRHLGCIFCREALKDLAKLKPSFEEKNQELVLVHMEEDDVALTFFAKYGLKNCIHIEDQEQRLYKQFGLSRGNISQLFGFKTMVRGFSAGISMDQFGGPSFGDAFQMPGIFVLYKRAIRAQYIHKVIADRPDYEELLKCSTELK
ncbi:MAG: AhpC/TSA family protein [Saprospiraceae bacterium]|nr:AhpC/TSA family protein [Saprospiraceae bacterium]